MAPRAAAVFRAGVARRAHRHQAARVRVARFAAVLFQGAQLPAERAARQGDRGFHRGRESRSADGRAPFRAGQPVPPSRGGRARHPHASESRRAARSAGRSEARGAFRARAGLSQSGASRPRGGALSQAREHQLTRKPRSDSCSRSTSRRRTGRKRSASPRSSNRSPAARTRKRSRTSIASSRAAR